MVLTQAKWQAKGPGTFCEAPTCFMYKVFCVQATKADTREKTGLSRSSDPQPSSPVS